MSARLATNRYLRTPGRRALTSRALPGALLLGPLIGGPLLAICACIAGSALESGALVALGILAGFALFLGATVAAWIFLLSGHKSLALASQLWLAGDSAGPIPLCQTQLARVFRADIRMRALYTLGLCAEANGDFVEAEDLFRRAYASIPSFAAEKWKRHGRCLMLSHSAIALVATGRLADADGAVRMASALFPPLPGNRGLLGALADDAPFGAAGVSGALRDLEPGRDPRALVTLASAVVLAGRGMGREAQELVDRERYFLNAGLLPRERALLENIEARSRGLLAGGPMRSPGTAGPSATDTATAWAARVLPT